MSLACIVFVVPLLFLGLVNGEWRWQTATTRLAATTNLRNMRLTAVQKQLKPRRGFEVGSYVAVAALAVDT